MEDKQFICDMLLNALRATDSYRDVVGITYVKSKHSDESHVVIHFLSGTRIICTTMDSGFAMIKEFRHIKSENNGSLNVLNLMLG